MISESWLRTSGKVFRGGGGYRVRDNPPPSLIVRWFVCR